MDKLFFLSFVFLASALLEFYAFQNVKTLFPLSSGKRNKIFRLIYLSFTSLILLSFVFYNFGDREFLGKGVLRFILFLMFMNFLAKLFLVIFLLIDDFRRGIKWTIRKLSKPKKKLQKGEMSRSEFLAKTGLVVAALPLVSMSWGIVSGAHDYRIRRVKLPLKNLPSSIHGLKIAQISDIHSGSFWSKTAVKGGVEMLMDEKADLIFFTGDLVNNRAAEMKDWISVFSKIKAPMGVFSSLGNHDYGDYVSWESEAAKRQNLEDLKIIQKNMGWQLLANENRSIEVAGEKIGVVGVENWSNKARFPQYGDLPLAMNGLHDTSLNILLSHDPSHWRAEVLPKYPNIDLTLSGHTHGMQFGVDIPGFKWSPVQYLYEEWAGLYSQNHQHLYVNRGFGYIGYPGRIGILPEITIFTLEKTSSFS